MRKSSLINVSGLSKSFAGQNVLDNISFEIKQGDKVALIGNNGTGKTTLIKLIAGLITPNSGIVKIDECNMHNSNIEKPILSICLDESMLDHRLTVIENLEFYSKLMSIKDPLNEINQMLEMFGCKNIVNAQIKLLSSGMRQRVSLIRALLNFKNHKLLLLDEPTKNLDYNSKNILTNEILCMKDSTIISATHDIDNINQWATKIIEIKNNLIKVEEIEKR